MAPDLLDTVNLLGTVMQSTANLIHPAIRKAMFRMMAPHILALIPHMFDGQSSSCTFRFSKMI